MGNMVKVKASGGGEFDCYLALPQSGGKAPAVVMATSVHGVDADHCSMADEFAKAGFIAAIPDLFWRTIPGPIPAGDQRAGQRSQPRLQIIKTGEADMADTLSMVKTLPQHNGKAISMGFCFGGPYAVLGPKRLGYDAGIGCHSTQMKDFLHEFDGLSKPVCIIWGDKDHAAPKEVLDAYSALAKQKTNVAVHIFPGVEHGYMMRSRDIWHESTYNFSMGEAVKLLKTLQ